MPGYKRYMDMFDGPPGGSTVRNARRREGVVSKAVAGVIDDLLDDPDLLDMLPPDIAQGVMAGDPSASLAAANHILRQPAAPREITLNVPEAAPTPAQLAAEQDLKIMTGQDFHKALDRGRPTANDILRELARGEDYTTQFVDQRLRRAEPPPPRPRDIDGLLDRLKLAGAGLGAYYGGDALYNYLMAPTASASD